MSDGITFETSSNIPENDTSFAYAVSSSCCSCCASVWSCSYFCKPLISCWSDAFVCSWASMSDWTSLRRIDWKNQNAMTSRIRAMPASTNSTNRRRVS